MLRPSPCTTPSWRHRLQQLLYALPAALLFSTSTAWARQLSHASSSSARTLPRTLPRMAEQVSLNIPGSSRLAGEQRGSVGSKIGEEDDFRHRLTPCKKIEHQHLFQVGTYHLYKGLMGGMG